MAEKKTPPLAATLRPDARTLRSDRVAGSFAVSAADEDGEFDFYYVCPCGCGAVGLLIVAANRKPDFSPSWNWNGLVDKPTLTPSVNHVGHWHGWLRDGIWHSV